MTDGPRPATKNPFLTPKPPKNGPNGEVELTTRGTPRKIRRKSPTNKEFREIARARGRKIDRDGRLLTKDPADDKAMNEFWTNVPKAEILDVLRSCDEPNMLNLVTTLLDPTYGYSISKACRDNNITLQQLNDLWRNHQLAMGLLAVSAQIPKVMLDTAYDASAKFDVCDRCDGVGTVTRTKLVKGGEDDPGIVTEYEDTCPKCKGAREVRIGGDPKARDTFFGFTGVTAKTQAGPLVAIQQNIGVGDSLEDTLNITQKLLQRKED